MTEVALHQEPQTFISITKERLIARYKMHIVPGRPEELETYRVFRVEGGRNSAEEGIDVTRRVVSLAYSGGEMRIRKHGGDNNREWLDTQDFRLRDGWLSEVYHYLDEWLGYPIPQPPWEQNPFLG